MVIGVVAAGCGGGSSSAGPSDADAATSDMASPSIDISGWYQVTSFTEGACGAPTAVSFGPAFVWVERRMSTFVFHACSGSTEADCTGTLFYDFTQPIDRGWAAEGGSGFYSAGCTLTFERAQATLNGIELRAQSLRVSTVTNDLTASSCTVEAARMVTAPCTFETDLVATRL
jgi:hypothetical protein